MTCLVAAATAFEIAPFLDAYRRDPAAVSAEMNIDVLITGVGLLASAYHLQRQLHIKRPDLLIQAGIAGSFDTHYKLGSVVQVSKDMIADQGVYEEKNWKSVFDLGLQSPNQFPYRKGWLVNPHKALMKQARLPRVAAVSVNRVSEDRKMIRIVRDRYQPVVESMEGAALHYIALQEDIPFLQIRSISNYVGERNKKKWNIKESVFNLNNELIRLLNALTLHRN